MISNPPDWLSEKLKVSPWSSNTYDVLYDYFCDYIRDAGLRYGGFRVIIPKEVEDEKERIFWHITSRDNWVWNNELRKKVKQRLPDFDRCSRISWINPIITHCSDPEVQAWDYIEGDNKTKTYLWLKNYDFVVIFKKFPDGNRLFLTSFYVNINHKKEEFERKYKDRVQ